MARSIFGGIVAKSFSAIRTRPASGPAQLATARAMRRLNIFAYLPYLKVTIFDALLLRPLFLRPWKPEWPNARLKCSSLRSREKKSVHAY
jgi:hypothetical protein